MSSVTHLMPPRRLRAGTPPPPEADTFAGQLHDQVNVAVQAAYKAGHDDGEHSGYISGLRAGRLAAFVWGLLIGALAIWSALQLGLLLG